MRKKITLWLLFIILIISIVLIFRLFLKKKQPPPASFKKITLQRTLCFGACPVYKLTIFNSGKIIYQGEKFVKIKGKRTSFISETKIKQLLQEFKKVNYLSLKNKYENFNATDMPYALTSITINGETKRVKHYLGDFSAPKKLIRLENKIDEITNSKKWIR